MTTRVKPKHATDELNVNKFNKTSNLISGTSIQLDKHLQLLEEEIKADTAGLKEFGMYQKKLEMEKAEIQARIDKNKEWIEKTGKSQGDSGAVEQQYKALLDKINEIYESAKDSHAQGVDMLIKDFNYHLAYKRWNDTFSAVPFKPQ